MVKNNKPWIFITYARQDNDKGNLYYLVQELEEIGVEVDYDEKVIIPGRHLWPQIADKINEPGLDGWGSLITLNSVSSRACHEELVLALDRALDTKGDDFPLIGLVHQVPRNEIPALLRTRLYVDLRDKDWPEKVKAGLEGREPRIKPEKQEPYIFTVHRSYLSKPNLTAVEVQPRMGEIMYWRFAVPINVTVACWGVGPAGGGAISSIKNMVIEVSGMTIKGKQVNCLGAGSRLSPSISAYVVFDGEAPDTLYFGLSPTDYGLPHDDEWVKVTLS